MKKEIRYNFNKKIVTLALVGIILVSSSCLMYFYNPLKMITDQVLKMEPGTLFYKLWQAPPYDIIEKIFIFNVTNPEEFLRGEEKLNLTEVGPYCYREVLTNQNSTYDPENATVTFFPNREIIFDRECSVGDAAVDRLLVPNLPLLGIQSYLASSSIITNLGFATLSATLGSQSFVQVTVDQYLWGYEDKLVSVANQFVPNWIDFGKFGILERVISRDNNNKVVIAVDPTKRKSRYEHLLSKNELMDPFHIVSWNDQEGLSEWGYDPSDEAVETTKKCQLVEGSFDGTIYPRPMRKNSSITMFRKAFCRPVVLEFVEEAYTKQGFRSYNYKMPNNMFASKEENPDNECYCYQNDCPHDGLQNIAPCYYGIPVALSQPHFLNSLAEIINSVNGLKPDEKKHTSVAKMQPDLGIPLDESVLRVQINMAVAETKFNSKTRPFNGLAVPIMWVELTCESLSPLISFLLTLVIDVLPIAQKVLVYLIGIIGLALISGAALLTLFFTKTVVPRSMSLVAEYSPLPLINIPAQYFKEKEKRYCK